MVYKTILLIIFNVVCLNGQIILNPDRANTINSPSGGCSLSMVDTSGSTVGSTVNAFDTSIKAWMSNRITPSTTRYIDAASIYVTSITGAIDSIDFVCEVWTLDVSLNLDTKQGSTSGTLNGMSTGWNQFTFASQITITTSPSDGYVILFKRLDYFYNASHYPVIPYGNSDWQPTGETAVYLQGTSDGLANETHGTLEYTIRWSDCD